MKNTILAVLISLVMFSQLAFADATLDAAAAAGATEIASWYAATGFIPIVGGGLVVAALIIVGFVWLKATIFSST